MTLESLEQLLVRQLEELYGAEKQGKKTMGRMVRAAQDTGLKNTFETQLNQTEQHMKRLEEIFTTIGEKPRTLECRRIDGLMDDCLHAIRERAEPHVHDVALIAVAQFVHHDQIAGYGCARTWAQLLGHTTAADLLQVTLDEEKASDRQLTQLAERINPVAMAV